ncbi:AraC family transcriptional regulator [Peristeroidobacter soli]|uniref:AraC family transcriptional regulator n=1 Tax=Peristeroidobacter soli TaxID=2497877 RepID=UPI00101DF4A1|nr:helix-turn-helix transcriptional regulator [Peristeroidobacter soli]
MVSKRTPAKLQNIPRPLAALAEEYPAGHVEPAHRHLRGQLLYASKGVMSVLTPAGGFVVPPERAVWLPPMTPHEVRCRQNVSLRTLYIDCQSSPRLPGTCCVIEVSELLRALIVAAVDIPVEYDFGGREGHIMALILDEIGAMPIAPLSAPIPADSRLARICRTLFREPSQNQTLAYWARAAGMSRRTLTRLFRQQTGMSFAAWRQQVRLLEALSRLAAGQSVTAVALDVGYLSPSAFTARFRQTFGTTPTRYCAQGTDAEAGVATHLPKRASGEPRTARLI